MPTQTATGPQPEANYFQQIYNYMSSLQHGGNAPVPNMPGISFPGDADYQAPPPPGNGNVFQDFYNWYNSQPAPVQQQVMSSPPEVLGGMLPGIPLPQIQELLSGLGGQAGPGMLSGGSYISAGGWHPGPGGTNPTGAPYISPITGTPTPGSAPSSPAGTPLADILAGTFNPSTWDNVMSAIGGTPSGQPGLAPAPFAPFPIDPNTPAGPAQPGPGGPMDPNRPGAGVPNIGELDPWEAWLMGLTDDPPPGSGGSTGMTMAQRGAIADAQLGATWRSQLAESERIRAMHQPYTYSGGFIPAGGSGGAGSAGGGVNPITSLPGFGDDSTTASGEQSGPGETPTGSNGNSGPDGPPVFTPTTLPPPISYGDGQNVAQPTGGATAGTTGGSTAIPEWLAPFLGQTGGGMTPEITQLLESLGLSGGGTIPQYPASPGTTGGTTPGTTPGTTQTPTPGGVTVPPVQLPQAPNLPNPTLEFPTIPGYQNTLPPYDPTQLTDLWNQITGQGTGVGSGGSNGTAPGGLFPGQQGASGTAGGAVGSGNALLDQLMADYQTQQDAANQANETRYNDILSGYADRHTNALDLLGNLGQTERNSLDQAYERQMGSTSQSLTSRGLSNTTVMPGVLRGIENDYNRAQGELQERVNRTALGVDTGLSGDLLQFMERRTDAGPDSSFLAQLAQGMGAAGNGSGATGQTSVGGQGTGSGTGQTANVGTGSQNIGALEQSGGQLQQPQSFQDFVNQYSNMSPPPSGQQQRYDFYDSGPQQPQIANESGQTVLGNQSSGGNIDWSQFGYNNSPSSSANNWSSPNGAPQTGGGSPVFDPNRAAPPSNVTWNDPYQYSGQRPGGFDPMVNPMSEQQINAAHQEYNASPSGINSGMGMAAPAPSRAPTDFGNLSQGLQFQMPQGSFDAQGGYMGNPADMWNGVSGNASGIMAPSSTGFEDIYAKWAQKKPPVMS